jgi:hypothetical protein
LRHRRTGPRIGDFSRASHLSVKTLRHYHEVGLLEPSEVDLNNASGNTASITGGQENTASGPSASITGGQDNTANWDEPSVAGGGGNNTVSHCQAIPSAPINSSAGCP